MPFCCCHVVLAVVIAVGLMSLFVLAAVIFVVVAVVIGMTVVFFADAIIFC